jgi:hypothetical protein
MLPQKQQRMRCGALQLEQDFLTLRTEQFNVNQAKGYDPVKMKAFLTQWAK